MYIDDIKTFAEKEKGFEDLIQKISIYNNEIRMEFRTEKHAMLRRKSETRKQQKE